MTYKDLVEKAMPLWIRYLNFEKVPGYGERDPSASTGTW
jgi:hypothetical protein